MLGVHAEGVAGDLRSAARGLVRLLRLDPAWDRDFDFSTAGLLRSFTAPLLALPPYVLANAWVGRATANGGAVAASVLVAAGLAHLLDAFGFALLLALIAWPLRVTRGYAAFVTVNNWATLYLTLALTAAAALSLLGEAGLAMFGLATLILLCLSVLLAWRMAWETLSRELPVVLLVVLLTIAWSTAADQLARLAVGAAG